MAMFGGAPVLAAADVRALNTPSWAGFREPPPVTSEGGNPVPVDHAVIPSGEDAAVHVGRWIAEVLAVAKAIYVLNGDDGKAKELSRLKPRTFSEVCGVLGEAVGTSRNRVQLRWGMDTDENCRMLENTRWFFGKPEHMLFSNFTCF